MRKVYALFIFSLVMVMTNSLFAQEKIGKEEFLKKIWNYEEDPNEFILRSDKPVILDFYADWCGPCRMLAPELVAIQNEYSGRIVIYKINVDHERELAQIFNARALPTIFFIPKEGGPTYVQGYRTKEELKQMVDNFLLIKPRIQEKAD